MSLPPKQYVLVAPLTYTGTASAGFTYEIDAAASIAAGQIVKVPLGKRQSLGVITAVAPKQPSFPTKPVIEVLDMTPLPLHIVELASWLSAYYFASPKAVWQTLLPSGITRKRRGAKVQPEGLILKPQNQPLTPDQQKAFRGIMKSDDTTSLIHGVTGSGKTRLYLELTATHIKAGRSAIILVPEIALTPQLIALFEASFPGRVVPFHSGLTEAQKHQAWQRALESQEPLVVVGPRSSLFLPLAKLGLIVMDECHESSYKQEQNPRYHTMPTAAKLARLAGAKLVLGSATPGLTEVYAAETGRITLYELPKRVENRPQPTSIIVDMRDSELRGPSSLISRPLLDALRQTLDNGRQSLLFLNRRGTASSQICNHCGEVTLCPTCQLPLTFHADHMKLMCHFCNYRQVPEAVCPHCGTSELRYAGGGTKRIETEIEQALPHVRVFRLDKDSAQPQELPKLYERLHQGEIDILIGTQMIAKGLDLPNIDTVGVVNADSMLHMPDFHSAERTFQLLTQVSGRAGRGDRPGKVYIQTRTPDHPAIQAVKNGNFWDFAKNELAQRRLLGYPPFRYLLKLTYSHKDEATAVSASQALYDTLKQNPAVRVLGPAPAFHARLGGQFHWQLIIKAADRRHLVVIASTLPSTWKTDLDPINVL
ncbi:MAG TPA: primosomal protein N' [Candidatus Saccharimonadia bacterium]